MAVVNPFARLAIPMEIHTMNPTELQVQCCVCRRIRDGHAWIAAKPDNRMDCSHTYCPDCHRKAMAEVELFFLIWPDSHDTHPRAECRVQARRQHDGAPATGRPVTNQWTRQSTQPEPEKRKGKP